MTVSAQKTCPGRINDRQGNDVQIFYDDGDREWTTMAYICVRRNDLWLTEPRRPQRLDQTPRTRVPYPRDSVVVTAQNTASVRAEFDLVTAIFTQIAITSTQLMTHYGNEYFDLPADRENKVVTYWAGSSRILVDTDIPARVAYWSSNLFAIIGVVAIRRARRVREQPDQNLPEPEPILP